MKNDCLFCAIAAGEIPAYVVYEDELFLVIPDKFPAAPGHVLIMPKRHASDLFELNEAEAAAFMPLVKQIAEKINREFKPDGLNVLQNNGKAAGQVIFHYHMHLIPRYSGDGIRFILPHDEATLEELEETAKKLR